MLDEPAKSIAPLSVSASASSDRVPPPWWAKVATLLRYAWASWWPMALGFALRSPRKAGTYEACDFVLLLLARIESRARFFTRFYEEATPIAQPLMALWARDKMPSRAALSRWLRTLTEENVELVRTLFYPIFCTTACAGRRSVA